MNLINYILKFIYIIILYINIYLYIMIKTKKDIIKLFFKLTISLIFIFFEYIFFSKYIIKFWSIVFYIIILSSRIWLKIEDYYIDIIQLYKIFKKLSINFIVERFSIYLKKYTKLPNRYKIRRYLDYYYGLYKLKLFLFYKFYRRRFDIFKWRVTWRIMWYHIFIERILFVYLNLSYIFLVYYYFYKVSYFIYIYIIILYNKIILYIYIKFK